MTKSAITCKVIALFYAFSSRARRADILHRA
jgi:hypothetical protein